MLRSILDFFRLRFALRARCYPMATPNRPDLRTRAVKRGDEVFVEPIPR